MNITPQRQNLRTRIRLAVEEVDRMWDYFPTHLISTELPELEVNVWFRFNTPKKVSPRRYERHTDTPQSRDSGIEIETLYI